MAINLGSNFAMQAALPLDSRDTVADSTARDAILAGVRYEGMKVFVTATKTNYQLVGGITNGDWVDIGSAAGISNDTSVINALIFG